MNRVDAVGFHGDCAEGKKIVGRGVGCHGSSIAQKGRIGERGGESIKLYSFPASK